MPDSCNLENVRASTLNDNVSPSNLFRNPFVDNVNYQRTPSYPQLNYPMVDGRQINNFGYSTMPNNYNYNYNHLMKPAFGGDYNSFGMRNWINIDVNKYQTLNESESRLIQLAELNSRPAFESIETIVAAISNISSMLDNSYFALTNSFRAFLGIAANFWHLRRLFLQFWETFFLCHQFRRIYKKIFFWIKTPNKKQSNFNPMLKAAFAESFGDENISINKKTTWPALIFLSFVFTTPYLLVKMVGSFTDFDEEASLNPQKWINPIKTTVLYRYAAKNPTELSIQKNQQIFLAPKDCQNKNNLLNTGWALASIDGKTSGLVPVNYLKNPTLILPESY